MPSFGDKSAANSYPFRNVVFILIRIFCHGCVIKAKYQPRLNLERKMGWQLHKYVRDSTKFVKISKYTHHANDAHFFVVSSINKTSIITKVSIKFMLLVRRKSSKLFERRRNEESLRINAATCLG